MRRCSSSWPSSSLSAPLINGITARCEALLANHANELSFATTCLPASSSVEMLSGKKCHPNEVPAWASVILSVSSAKAETPAGLARHSAAPEGGSIRRMGRVAGGVPRKCKRGGTHGHGCCTHRPTSKPDHADLHLYYREYTTGPTRHAIRSERAPSALREGCPARRHECRAGTACCGAALPTRAASVRAPCPPAPQRSQQRPPRWRRGSSVALAPQPTSPSWPSLRSPPAAGLAPPMARPPARTRAAVAAQPPEPPPSRFKATWRPGRRCASPPPPPPPRRRPPRPPRPRHRRRPHSPHRRQARNAAPRARAAVLRATARSRRC